MELTEIFTSEVANEIERRLAILTSRERKIFLSRRGFDRNGSPLTYEMISREFQVTRERIRQLWMRTLQKLRESSDNEFPFSIPRFSCECKKYQGKRFLGIVCDKCGKDVLYQGEIQTTL